MNDTKSKLDIGRDINGTITSIKLEIPVAIKSKDSVFTVFSPSFKCFGYGDSEAQAITDLENSLRVFFDVHIERETLDLALSSYGWTKTNAEYEGKAPKVPTRRTIELELPLMAAA